MFRNNNHPDVALLSTDDRHITRSARGQYTVLNIVGAWQLFHEKLGSPRVFAIQPSAVSPTLDRVEYVRVRWTGIISPLNFTDQDQHVYQVQSLRTRLKACFGLATCPRAHIRLTSLFLRTWTWAKRTSSIRSYFPPYQNNRFNVGGNRPQRSWNTGATTSRPKKRSRVSYLFTHRKASLTAWTRCAHGERVVWRSSEFITTFGDVHWLEVECHSYDDAMIGVLQRQRALGDFTMRDVDGQKRTFHSHMIYGIKTAPHALLIGTWYEGDAPDVLTRFCEHEKRLDPTFTPTPYTSLRVVYSTRVLMYKMRGFRVATDDEIAAARERVTSRFGAVMDLMRPVDDTYVWIPKPVSAYLENGHPSNSPVNGGVLEWTSSGNIPKRA